MDYVMWEISYANLMMLMAAIPSYGKKKNEGTGGPVDKELDGLDELEQYLNFE